MLRSVHMKLVMIMVLLILSLMTVVGTFLINSVMAFYLEEFSKLGCRLLVATDNGRAFSLYRREGFRAAAVKSRWFQMIGTA